MSWDPTGVVLQGATGYTGYTGPTMLTPSAYVDNTPVGTTYLSDVGPNGASVIGHTDITQGMTGYIYASSFSTFENTTNIEANIQMYVGINGETGPLVRGFISKTQGGATGFLGIGAQFRTLSKVAPGATGIYVYAYSPGSSGIKLTQCDVFAMGNLD